MLRLITDRSQQDVDAIIAILRKRKSARTPEEQSLLDNANSKGSYNYTDLNRVTAAMEYINNQLVGYGYQTGYQRVEVPHKVGSMLPDGYTELEYIESTGTQYIDTGIIPTSELCLDMSGIVSSYSTNFAFFGSRKQAVGTDQYANLFLGMSNGKLRSDYYGSSVSSAGTLSGEFLINRNENSTVANDIEVVNTNTQVQVSSEVNLYLFATNTNNVASLFGKFKMVSCAISLGSNVLRDYIPCTNQDGEAGLYDTVGNQFYGNAGTGLFIAGPEVPNTPDPSLDPYTWYESDRPRAPQMEAYLANVEALRSTLDVLESTPQTPESMEALTWVEANNIEQILLDVQKMINQVVESFSRSNAFTFWSGNRPLPSADSDLGRTWEELDAMNTSWCNWQVADWYLLLYGNLKAEGVVE